VYQIGKEKHRYMRCDDILHVPYFISVLSYIERRVEIHDVHGDRSQSLELIEIDYSQPRRRRRVAYTIIKIYLKV
jgi:hypothetical protein